MPPPVDDVEVDATREMGQIRGTRHRLWDAGEATWDWWRCQPVAPSIAAIRLV